MADVNLGSVFATLELRTGEWEQNLQRIQGGMQGFSGGIANTLDRAGGSFLDFAGRMAIPAAAITLVGKSIIGLGLDFEESMAKVAGVAGVAASETDKSFVKLRDTAIDLGIKTRFSATEAAEGLYELASAGLGVGKSIETLPAILDLATASQMDLGTTSLLVVNAMKAFEATNLTAAHASDVMTKGVTSSTLHFSDLQEALPFVAGAFGQLGLSIEDAVAALAIMNDAGVRGGRAGEYLRQTMSALVDPTSMARDAMKSLGIITKDGANKIFDAQGKIKSFDEIIRIFTESTKGLTQEQRMQALGQIFQVQGAQAMNTIIQKGTGVFDKYKKSLVESDGAAKKMADTFNKTTKFSVDQLKSSVETLGIKMVETLGPAIKGILDSLTRFANKMTEIAKVSPGVVKVLGVMAVSLVALTALSGIVGIMLRALVPFFNFAKWISSVTGLTASMEGAVGMAGKLKLALNALPMAVVITVGLIAIDIVMEQIKKLNKELDDLEKSQEQAGQGIEKMLERSKELAKSGSKEDKKRAIELRKQAKGIADDLRKEADDYSTYLDRLSESVMTGIAILFTGGIGAAVVSTFNRLKTIDWSGLWAGFGNSLLEIQTGFGIMWDNIKKGVNDALASIGTAIITGWGRIKDALAPYLYAIYEIVNVVFASLVAVVIFPFQQIWKALVSIWTAIYGFLAPILSSIWIAIVNTWQSIATFTSTIWSGIATFFATIWNGILTTISTIATAIYNSIVGLWNKVANTASGPLNRMKDSVVGVFNSIKTSIGKVISDAYNWGKNLIENLAKGIRDLAWKVGDAAKGVADKIWKYLGFGSPTKEGPGRYADEWMPNLIDMFYRQLKYGSTRINSQLSGIVGGLAVPTGTGSAFGGVSSVVNIYGGVNVRDDEDITKLANAINDRIVADFSPARKGRG